MNKQRKTQLLVIVCTLIFQCLTVSAQKHPPQRVVTSDEVEQYKQDATRMIAFLQYTLNILGNDSNTTEEKEAVIYSSYLKLYRDKKVLIEDDLDVSRKVPTLKPVQSYLQDIVYFFKRVNFTFDIQSIELMQESDVPPYLKVSMERRLQGIGFENDTVFNTQRRYVELAIDLRRKELKIASIYSSKIGINEDLLNWWNALSDDWKSVLKREGSMNDSISVDQLKKLLELKSLNLSNQQCLSDFTPLTRFTELHELNAAGTGLASLDVLRNSPQLEVLNLNNTPIEQFSEVNYFHKLTTLYLNNTLISSIDFVKDYPNLRSLTIANTDVTNIAAISGCTNLTQLDIADTKIESIDQLSNLYNLRSINISNTPITDLASIKSLHKLEQLSMNNTWISNLDPIVSLTALKAIYCDNSGIHLKEATAYTLKHPHTLVIYQTEGLVKWWNAMRAEWKAYFHTLKVIDDLPTKEQLAELVNVDSINVAGNLKIKEVAPLQQLLRLRKVYIANTAVEDLKPIAGMTALDEVNCSSTRVNTLNTFRSLPKLKLLQCDDTPIDSAETIEFIRQHPQCLVVYKTQALATWWSALDSNLKAFFCQQFQLPVTPSNFDLHRLIRCDSLHLNAMQIKSFNALNVFQFMHNLRITNCSLSSFPDLSALTELKQVDVSDNPIIDLSQVSKCKSLTSVNFSNTAIKDLSPLLSMPHLIRINCSGTMVKDITPLKDLQQLEYLNVSNTPVKRLGALEQLTHLTTLICFNTHLSKSQVDALQQLKPNCKIVYY